MGIFWAELAGMSIMLIVAARRKLEGLLNIVMRSVLGTIAIYFINMAMAEAGISLNVGINPITPLTCGILGFPGVAGLYGLSIFQLL